MTAVDHAPQRRARSTPDEMAAFRSAIIDHIERLRPYWPLTVRQTFYVAVSALLIEKTQPDYRRVQRQLKVMREDGSVPWKAITDTGRNIMHLSCYRGPGDALSSLADRFSLDPRRDQRSTIIIGVEEAGLMSQVWRVAGRFGPLLVPCKGYSSITALHDVADLVRAIGKPVVWFAVGDLDPSGEDAAQVANKTARRYCGVRWSARPSWWHYQRIAITELQADDHGLTWHAINPKDPRAGKWERDGAIELEALPPDILAATIGEALKIHTDMAALEQSEADEARHVATLRRLARRYAL